MALVGSETLLGRELRDVVSSSGGDIDLKLIAGAQEEAGTLTEQAGEAALITGLEAESLRGVDGVFLAASPELNRKALEMQPRGTVIDLAHTAEEDPQARLRAPLVEPNEVQPGAGVQVIAHPAAIALAMFFKALHARHAVARSVVHIFEPASERGAQGIEELQQQTVSLLSFKGMPKKIFDAQLSFNLLARYGDEAPSPLEDVELRIERHLATLLSNSSRAPLPSLRLIQAPVFHGHSFSLWVEFEENPGVEAIERALAAEGVDVRGAGMEPPNIVGVAGQSGIAVGSIALDRNRPSACWVWMAADNLRLAAENAVAVAREAE